MSQSNKNSGLLVFIVIALLFLFVFVPVVRFALFHAFGVRIMGGPFMFPLGDAFHGPQLVFIPILLITLVWLLIAVWVYNDAERSGMSGILWALLVFFGNVVALIIYLIVRASSTAPAAVGTASLKCPNCHGAIHADFSVCPHCGTSLRQTCPSCEKPVESTWKHCPYCGESLEGAQ